LIRWLGLFMGIILLTTFLATAQEDYAVTISGSDIGRIETEGLGGGIIVTKAPINPATDAVTSALEAPKGSGVVSDPYVIKDFSLRNFAGNGIMIANTDAYMILRDINVENLSVRDRSSLPVGIGMQNAKNVLIENCMALGGELFRIANSQNIRVKNNKAKNFFFEGVKDSIIENCTSDCIMIKGGLSPFYLNKFINPLRDDYNDTFSGQPEDTMVGSQRCVVKDCNRVKEIDMFDAEDCSIENCSVENVGLWMMNANNVTFRNSTVTNATISMDWSKKINFENVTLINSDISMGGSVPEDYAIALRNSTVDGKPIYYYKNQRELKLENISAGHIWLVNCSGSVVNNVNAHGIFVISSDGVAIRNSQVDGAGVNFAFSKDCVVSNNRLTDKRSKDGILEYAVCNNNSAISNVLF
jgi:hypothetical protein